MGEDVRSPRLKEEQDDSRTASVDFLRQEGDEDASHQLQSFENFKILQEDLRGVFCFISKPDNFWYTKISMYYLYILKCADKTLYTGITVNLKRRVGEHNLSKLGAKYTRARRPVKLVYARKFKNRSLASKAENKIKKLSREEKLKLIHQVK